MHVTAVGSDSPGKQELEAACLARADIVVVDRLSQCARFGELSHALAAGLLREADVRGQLGELVAGRKPGRTRDDEMTICDLTGVGFQDTAIAALAWGLYAGLEPVKCRTAPSKHGAGWQRECMMIGTGTGIRTPVPWLRTTCPNP